MKNQVPMIVLSFGLLSCGQERSQGEKPGTESYLNDSVRLTITKNADNGYCVVEEDLEQNTSVVLTNSGPIPEAKFKELLAAVSHGWRETEGIADYILSLGAADAFVYVSPGAIVSDASNLTGVVVHSASKLSSTSTLPTVLTFDAPVMTQKALAGDVKNRAARFVPSHHDAAEKLIPGGNSQEIKLKANRGIKSELYDNFATAIREKAEKYANKELLCGVPHRDWFDLPQTDQEEMLAISLEKLGK